MTPVHARLRHRVSGKFLIVTATPGDGRYAEEYKLTEAEARRFAWAILADIDHDEATAAATEQGADLVTLTTMSATAARGPHGRTVAGCNLPPSTSKSAKLLECLRHGPLTTPALAALVPDAQNPSALLCNLRDNGCVFRLEGDGRGTRSAWALTQAAAQRFGVAWPDVAQTVAA